MIGFQNMKNFWEVLLSTEYLCPVTSYCWLKKNVQCESCELGFTWGKMKTAAWETTPQIALKNCSKEVGGERQYSFSRSFLLVSWNFLLVTRKRVITMKDFSAFLDMKRYKNWAHKIGSWKCLSGNLSFWFFPRAQSASFPFSILNSFQGVLKFSSYNSMWFNPCRGRWQVLMASAYL